MPRPFHLWYAQHCCQNVADGIESCSAASRGRAKLWTNKVVRDLEWVFASPSTLQVAAAVLPVAHN